MQRVDCNGGCNAGCGHEMAGTEFKPTDGENQGAFCLYSLGEIDVHDAY